MSNKQMIQDIAKAFLSEELTFRDVDTTGISELGINFKGVPVDISWYSGGDLRSYSIDNLTSFTAYEIAPVLKAAKKRVELLTKEDNDKISNKLGYKPDVVETNIEVITSEEPTLTFWQSFKNTFNL